MFADEEISLANIEPRSAIPFILVLYCIVKSMKVQIAFLKISNGGEKQSKLTSRI